MKEIYHQGCFKPCQDGNAVFAECIEFRLYTATRMCLILSVGRSWEFNEYFWSPTNTFDPRFCTDCKELYLRRQVLWKKPWMVVRKPDRSADSFSRVSIAPVDTPFFAQGDIKVSVKVPRNLCTVNHRVHQKKLLDRTIDSSSQRNLAKTWCSLAEVSWKTESLTATSGVFFKIRLIFLYIFWS